MNILVIGLIEETGLASSPIDGTCSCSTATRGVYLLLGNTIYVAESGDKLIPGYNSRFVSVIMAFSA